MNDRALLIRSDVFFAEVQGEGILLDLQADEYYGLDQFTTRVWKTLGGIDDYSRAKQVLQSSLGLTKGQAEEALDDLLEVAQKAHLLAGHKSVGFPLSAPLSGEAATAGKEFLDSDRLQLTNPKSTLVAQVALRFLLIKLQLRCTDLRRTLERLPPPPIKRLSQENREHVIYEVRKALGIVRSMFTRGDPDCIPRSFTMLYMLRNKGVSSNLCFGVQKFPFEAHAWVESDGQVVSTSDSTRLARYVVIARI